MNSYNNSLPWLENLKCNWNIGIGLLIATMILTFFCGLIIFQAKKNLETIPIEIDEIKTSDNEALGFVLLYLLPLLRIKS